MKKYIQLHESDINRMVSEAINELGRNGKLWMHNKMGWTPGFNRNNERHMKAFDMIKDSAMYAINTLKIRPDIITSILRSLEEDFADE